MIKNAGYFSTILLVIGIAFSFCGDSEADEIDDIIPYVIQVESDGNPKAISGAGAVGLMQITPTVLDEYTDCVSDYMTMGRKDRPEFYGLEVVALNEGMKSLYNPQKNKAVGEWYLRRLRDYYLKDAFYLLMDYFFQGDETRIWGSKEAKDAPHEVRDKRHPYIFDNTRYISLERFPVLETREDYELALILAAYNGGITRLRNNNYDINKMPRETRVYVRLVMKLYKEGK